MAERENRELPKWKLKANWLLRELARTWYGKESIFDLRYGHDERSPFWQHFVSIFRDLARISARRMG
jgi:hypothetical protein